MHSRRYGGGKDTPSGWWRSSVKHLEFFMGHLQSCASHETVHSKSGQIDHCDRQMCRDKEEILKTKGKEPEK